MTDEARVVVRVARWFAASPERVFDAWLDAGRMRKWLFVTPNGEMIRAEADPRVGGRFTFVERWDGVNVEHVGEYLEIDRPRRLVFNFAVPIHSAVLSQVTITVTPASEGCELVLTHEGVFAEYRNRTVEGWAGILFGLAASLD